MSKTKQEVIQAFHAQKRALEAVPAPIGECTFLNGLCEGDQLMSMLGCPERLDPYAVFFAPSTTKVDQESLNLLVHQAFESTPSPYTDQVCATDAPKVEHAIAKLLCVKPDSIIRGRSPMRDSAREGYRKCEAQPRYYVDGTQITNLRDWEQQVALEELMNSWATLLPTGDSTNTGHFDGTETILQNWYDNSTGNEVALNPNIVEWGGNPMTDSSATTWNGQALNGDPGLYDVVRNIVWLNLERKRCTPSLRNAPLNYGDMVLFVDQAMADCLLAHILCYKLCVDDLKWDKDTQLMRDELLRGGSWYFDLTFAFSGYGTVRIPVVVSAVMPAQTMHLFTMRCGGMDLWKPKAWDMRGNNPDGALRYFENGMIMGQTVYGDNKRCQNELLEMEPWLCCIMPQMQTIIRGVECDAMYTPAAFVPTILTCPTV